MQSIYNFLFPVTIYKFDKTLLINDRRPTQDLLLFGLSGFALIVFSIYLVLSSYTQIRDSRTWGIPALFFLGGSALVARSLFLTFSETFFFDKTTDSYVFTRRSALKKIVEQGSLSQLRAVQIMRTSRSHEGQRTVTYQTAVLLRENLLFGMSPTQRLREKAPAFATLSTEMRIAAAITDYLDFQSPEVIDVQH